VKVKTADEMRVRIEELMRWNPGASERFSLPTCRDFVRGRDPKFDQELALFIERGQHLFR